MTEQRHMLIKMYGFFGDCYYYHSHCLTEKGFYKTPLSKLTFLLNQVKKNVHCRKVNKGFNKTKIYPFIQYMYILAANYF